MTPPAGKIDRATSPFRWIPDSVEDDNRTFSEASTLSGGTDGLQMPFAPMMPAVVTAATQTRGEYVNTGMVTDSGNDPLMPKGQGGGCACCCKCGVAGGGGGSESKEDEETPRGGG